jgi:hypothetical protein
MYKCEYCLITITTKSNLSKHQKTKKCIIKQEELKKLENSKINQKVKEYEEKIKIITNEFKMKLEQSEQTIFNIKISSEQTINNLKINSEQTINNLKQTIKILEDWKEEQIKKLEKTNFILLEKATSKTNKTINNTNNYNLIPIAKIDMSPEKLRTVSKKLTRGIITSCLPKFCYNNLMKDENNQPTYTCSDKSRGNFWYRDEKNELVSDPLAKKITGKFLDVAYPNIKNIMEIYKEEIDEEDESGNKVLNDVIKDIKQLKKDSTTTKYWKALANLTYLTPAQRRIKMEFRKDEIEIKKRDKIEVKRNEEEDEDENEIEDKIGDENEIEVEVERKEEEKEEENKNENLYINVMKPYDEDVMKAFGLNFSDDEKETNWNNNIENNEDGENNYNKEKKDGENNEDNDNEDRENNEYNDQDINNKYYESESEE